MTSEMMTSEMMTSEVMTSEVMTSEGEINILTDVQTNERTQKKKKF